MQKFICVYRFSICGSGGNLHKCVLWKMIIDKNMKKSDLKEKAGISSASLAKLGKGDNITTDVLLRICEVMDCRIEDILETVRD